uniref:Uncharacterized protein n=1 Tax=Trichogramma kaykai TaxID=54128 RepID=A0ABD2WTW5_9HYME
MRYIYSKDNVRLYIRSVAVTAAPPRCAAFVIALRWREIARMNDIGNNELRLFDFTEYRPRVYCKLLHFASSRSYTRYILLAACALRANITRVIISKCLSLSRAHTQARAYDSNYLCGVLMYQGNVGRAGQREAAREESGKTNVHRYNTLVSACVSSSYARRSAKIGDSCRDFDETLGIIAGDICRRERETEWRAAAEFRADRAAAATRSKVYTHTHTHTRKDARQCFCCCSLHVGIVTSAAAAKLDYIPIRASVDAFIRIKAALPASAAAAAYRADASQTLLHLLAAARDATTPPPPVPTASQPASQPSQRVYSSIYTTRQHQRPAPPPPHHRTTTTAAQQLCTTLSSSYNIARVANIYSSVYKCSAATAEAAELCAQ